MKALKRCFALFFAFLLIFISGCTPYDSERMATEGRITCFLSNFWGSGAFVSSISWNGDLNNTDIFIPATCGGQKIVSLGGFFGVGVPTPMILTLENEASNAKWDETAVPVQFTVYFGKNIQAIHRLQNYECLPVEQNGEVIFVYPVYYMVCAEENSKYYTENGHVFKKSDGALVDTISYWDDAEDVQEMRR